MLIRTHLAITILAILALFNSVENKIIFVIVALIATFIPDIDTAFSGPGKRIIFRPLQLFVKHRGLIHSFSFLLLITLFFVLFFPVVALPLFLGYSLHLLADSFSIEGIRPFYPWGKNISWRIKTGGKTEVLIFILFIIADLLVLLGKFNAF